MVQAGGSQEGPPHLSHQQPGKDEGSWVKTQMSGPRGSADPGCSHESALCLLTQNSVTGPTSSPEDSDTHARAGITDFFFLFEQKADQTDMKTVAPGNHHPTS